MGKYPVRCLILRKCACRGNGYLCRYDGHFCKEKKVLGSREWPGGFGEFIISPEYLVHHVPDSITDEEAALLDPLCVGIHGLRKAGERGRD